MEAATIIRVDGRSSASATRLRKPALPCQPPIVFDDAPYPGRFKAMARMPRSANASRTPHVLPRRFIENAAPWQNRTVLAASFGPASRNSTASPSTVIEPWCTWCLST